MILERRNGFSDGKHIANTAALKIRVSLVRFRLRAQSKASHPSWMGGFFHLGHTGNRAQLPGDTCDTPIARPRVVHKTPTEHPQIAPHVCSQGSKNRRFCYISYIHRRKTPHSLLHPLLHQLHPPTVQLFSEATHHRHADKNACKFLEAQKPAILLHQLHPPTENTPFAATSLATAATFTDGKYPIRCYISCYSSYSHRRCSSLARLFTDEK